MRATEYAGAGPTADGISDARRARPDLEPGGIDSSPTPVEPVSPSEIEDLLVGGEQRRLRAEMEALTSARMRQWPARELITVALAASRVGPPELCQRLLAQVDGRDGGADDDDGSSPFVAVLCHMALGRYGEAREQFDQALPAAERSDPELGARVRAELGRLHLGLGPARTRSARAHLVTAAVCLRAADRSDLADQTAALLEGDGPVGGAGPQRGVLEPGPCWLVGFGLRAPTTMSDRPGLHALWMLIAARGRDVDATEVARRVGYQWDVAELVADTIGQLGSRDAEPADHLRRSISLDDELTYRPAAAVRWSLGPDLN